MLKTWLNGPVTLYRMTEPVLHNCHLGCRDCPDSLDHYMQCKHIFALTSFSIPDTSSDPLIWFGLMHPCKEQCKVVACIFSSYHAVKSTIRETQFASGGQNIDFYCGAALRNNWTLFAQTFGAEAGEMAINTRAFSVPAFLRFLINGGVHVPELGIMDSVQLVAHHDSCIALLDQQAPTSP